MNALTYGDLAYLARLTERRSSSSPIIALGALISVATIVGGTLAAVLPEVDSFAIGGTIAVCVCALALRAKNIYSLRDQIRSVGFALLGPLTIVAAIAAKGRLRAVVAATQRQVRYLDHLLPSDTPFKVLLMQAHRELDPMYATFVSYDVHDALKALVLRYQNDFRPNRERRYTLMLAYFLYYHCGERGVELIRRASRWDAW